MKTKLLLTQVSVLLVCLASSTAKAQSNDADSAQTETVLEESPETTKPRSSLTFAAKPYAKTKNYIYYGLGLKTQISGPKTFRDDYDKALTVDLGVMHNLNEKISLGLTLYASTGDRSATIGFRPRFRWWLGKSRGLDLSAGILLTGNEGGGYGASEYKWPGYIGAASIDLFRTLSVEFSLETLNPRVYSINGAESASQTSLYFGTVSKDYLALGATVVVGGLIVLIATSLDIKPL